MKAQQKAMNYVAKTLAAPFLALALLNVGLFVDGRRELARLQQEDSLEEALQEAKWVVQDYDNAQWYVKLVSAGYQQSAMTYMSNVAYRLKYSPPTYKNDKKNSYKKED